MCITTSAVALCLQEKVIKLDECIPGIDPEAVRLLLIYMYASDPMSCISGMDLKQLEAAAVLADVWAMSRFLELCDARLHGVLSRPKHLSRPYHYFHSIKEHLLSSAH